MEITESQRNQFIQKCLEEGMSLSQVQDQLAQQFQLHVTYMELRLLTAELQVNWEKQDARAMAARAARTPAAAQQPPLPPGAPPANGEEQEAWPQEEEESPLPPATPPPAADGADNTPRGTTTVEISKVVRPGASLSGTVKFGSGASGEWYVDAYGRLGFNADEGSSQPDQRDIQEFQAELQKALGY